MAERPPLTHVQQSEGFLQHREDIYQPIDPDAGEIRLMLLQPAAKRHEPIQIELTTAWLDSNDDLRESYEAVSYTWGDVTRVQDVCLCGHFYRVTHEQFAVLLRLRRSTGPRVLWMDVFCIDQENVAEKEKVIGQMSRIYRQCEKTLIWLGEPDDTWCTPISDAGFEAVIRMIEERRVLDEIEDTKTCRDEATVVLSTEYQNALSVDPNSDPDFEYGPEVVLGVASGLAIALMLAKGIHISQLPFYDADETNQRVLSRAWLQSLHNLCAVFTSRWWTRVWVMQEALQAPNSDPIVHIGCLRVPFRALLRAGHAISTALFDPRNETERVLAWSWTLGVPSLEAASRNVARFYETSWHLYGPSRQNDAVQIKNMQTKVDYSLSAGQVFSLASLRYMRILPKLSYFAYDKITLGTGVGVPDLPTWASNWAERGNICESIRFHQRHVTERSEPTDWDSINVDSTGKTLHLPAFPLDEITQCFAPSIQPRFQQVGQVVVQWYHEFSQAIHGHNPDTDVAWSPVVFFVTLLRGNMVETNHSTHDGNEEDEKAGGDSITLESCKKLLQDTIDIYQNVGNIGSMLEKSHQSYQLLRKAVTYSRMFMTRSGCLGIGPSSLAVGDELWHAQGCFTPLALKQQPEPGKIPAGAGVSSSSSSPAPASPSHSHPPPTLTHGHAGTFTFVGPCYVVDYMGRRAFQDNAISAEAAGQSDANDEYPKGKEWKRIALV